MSYQVKYDPFEFTPGQIQKPATFNDLVYQDPYPVTPEVQDQCGFVSASASSVHQCESPLVSAFFSPENVEYIQQRLRYDFYQRSGYSIDRQKPEDLVAIMRSVFVTNSQNAPGSAAEEILSLDQKVLDLCLPMVARGVEQFFGYVRDASSLPVPIARGEATSIKGTVPSEMRIGF